MESVWLKQYPPGIPAEADIARFSSLKDMLEKSCARYRALPAFTNMGVTISFDDLDRLSQNFAAYLQQVLGMRKGERIAIMLPNLLQYPVVLFGALRAGLVVVNVNPLYTPRELEHQLADSGATLVVVLENFAHTLQQALPATAVRHVVVTRVGDMFPPVKRCLINFAVKWIKRLVPRWDIPQATPFHAALAQGTSLKLAEIPLALVDTAFLQYTGGTTGVAKGVILTHGNLVANVEQTSAWIGSTLKEGQETVITPLPLYHIFALTANLLLFIQWGGRNVLITNPRDIPDFVRTLEKTRFTAITGVNTLYNMLLNSPRFARVKQTNGNALKLAVAGGMAVQRAVAERWQQTMGVPLIEGYGLTEASPIVCANRFDITGFSGKLGLPLPSTLMTILDESGHALPYGSVGEICVKGPQVMKGYWNRPDESRHVFTADGWLRTGDLGVMDDQGYITFVDRCKDVIVVSGFKVYPAEIEEVVMHHPGVAEVGAVGVPDEKSGEAVKIFVTRKHPTLTAGELLAYCHENLTPYKVPKHVEFREKLPKSPIGKILRRKLKEEHAS
ncbi:MAG: AMP-binding protein [Betaproteobacteria bacterium]|nr:AMP-binding protein [Betaproteobacteria bacterium]